MNELVNMFKMKNLPREVTLHYFTALTIQTYTSFIYIDLIESIVSYTKMGSQI
jgi:hypothetical protein